jgi:hypothetical protein
MKLVGAVSSCEPISVVPVVNGLARVIDRGETFVLWGEHTHKILEAAQWLAWKFNRMEEMHSLEPINNPVLSAVLEDLELNPLFGEVGGYKTARVIHGGSMEEVLLRG